MLSITQRGGGVQAARTPPEPRRVHGQSTRWTPNPLLHRGTLNGSRTLPMELQEPSHLVTHAPRAHNIIFPPSPAVASRRDTHITSNHTLTLAT